MSLQAEIEAGQADVKTDSYAMSIGEIINLYRDGELDLHPEFQRFYRWTQEQKSRLIESILLGIPLPPIFVAQREDGVWEVIDGLQRLSTILEFVGELKDAEGRPKPPLQLSPDPECYDYLHSLAGKYWTSPDPERALNRAQQLYIRRAKFDIIILLKGSNPRAKLDLFQRLNTGGSQLSDQEIRNCLMIMVDPEFYRWVAELSEYPPFRETLPLTERAVEEQYHVELVIRFLVFRTIPEPELGRAGDLTRFLNKRAIEMARTQGFDRAGEERAFRWVFDLLQEAAGADAFRRYKGERFVGGFLVSAFETIAIGLGYHYSMLHATATPAAIRRIIHQLWLREDYAEGLAAGVRASTRIPKTIPLGRELFATAEVVRG